MLQIRKILRRRNSSRSRQNRKIRINQSRRRKMRRSRVQIVPIPLRQETSKMHRLRMEMQARMEMRGKMERRIVRIRERMILENYRRITADKIPISREMGRIRVRQRKV